MGESSKAPKMRAAEKTKMQRRASVRGVCGTDHSFTVHSEWTAEHLVKRATVLDKFLKHAFLRFKSCFHLVYKTLGFCFDLFISLYHLPLFLLSILQFPSFPQQDPLLLSCNLLLYHLSICPSTIYVYMYLFIHLSSVYVLVSVICPSIHHLCM